MTLDDSDRRLTVLLMVQKSQTTTWDLENPVNTEINDHKLYIYPLVQDFSHQQYQLVDFVHQHYLVPRSEWLEWSQNHDPTRIKVGLSNWVNRHRKNIDVLHITSGIMFAFWHQDIFQWSPSTGASKNLTRRTPLACVKGFYPPNRQPERQNCPVAYEWNWWSRIATLQGTNISPQTGILKMIFLFPRWDMLVPWRVNASFNHLPCQMRPFLYWTLCVFIAQLRWPPFCLTTSVSLVCLQLLWCLPERFLYSCEVDTTVTPSGL